MQKVFDGRLTFEASKAAEAWCDAHGISVGQMQGREPRGLLFGRFVISKWRGMTRTERGQLHGIMTGDMRSGPVTVAIKADHEHRLGAAGHEDDEKAPTVTASGVVVVTHAEMVVLAARWVRNEARCSIVASETACVCRTMEIPDTIGWRERATVLVECKTSRADFLADRLKPFRKNPAMGMGSLRYFMAPAGMISAAELPQGWGLLEVHGRRLVLVVGIDPTKVRSTWDPSFVHAAKATESETALLLSCMNRVRKAIGEKAFRGAMKTRLAARRFDTSAAVSDDGRPVGVSAARGAEPQPTLPAP